MGTKISRPLPRELRTLGSRLRIAMDDAGVNQPELEKLSGVDQSMISKLRNDDAPGVGARILIELARALGVRAAWLICDDGEKRANQGTPVPPSAVRKSSRP